MQAFWSVLSAVLTVGCHGSVLTSEGNFLHHPVILVPGNGGNQLWARLKNTDSQWFCQRTSGNAGQMLWLELGSLVYPAVNCLAYNIMLRKSPEAASTIDNAGVESFVPGFGSVDTMLWLSEWQTQYTAYYSTLVEHLIDKHGFVKNVTLRGAPYDFRRAPDEFGEYFDRLKGLIEETFTTSGGKRIVLVAHSMGAKVALHFLHARSQFWKDKYIEHFVAAGGAFGGVPASLMALLSGYNLGIPLIKPSWFRPVQRSWPSTHYVLPSGPVYASNRPLVASSNGDQFSLGNISALFSAAGYPTGYLHYLRYSQLTDVTRSPGVPVTCAFGSGVDTPSSLLWHKIDDEASTSDVWTTESGDGTVAEATENVCHNWGLGHKNERVQVARISGADHVGLLSDPRFVSLVSRVAVTTG